MGIRNSFTSSGMVKTAAQFSPEQIARLESIARERQVSIAAVIRDAVRSYFTALDQEARETAAVT